MPYIAQKRREELAEITAISFLDCSPDLTPGELNYIFTEAALAYVRAKGISYQTINDIIGAMEGAKLEFYRRVAMPYEDAKIRENGDVLPPHAPGFVSKSEAVGDGKGQREGRRFLKSED